MDIETRPQQRDGALFSRRQLCYGMGGTLLTGLIGSALAGCGGSGSSSSTGANPTRDIAILNFALNLEYLEAEFYTYATTGKGIEAQGVPITGQNGTGGTATPGTTTGGALVSFDTSTLSAVANELASDERTHVIALRNIITSLGGQPVARPNINLAALSSQGVNIGTTTGFLMAARAFEDTGASAYAGASPYIYSSTLLQTAARVLAVEGYHSGNIRLQIEQRSISSPAIDSLDVPPPPTGTNYFDVTTNSLAVVRTPSQVLRIVYAAVTAATVPASGGFFPNGANANLTLLAPLG